jgi:hypothetical integral membrane protein (TIGR02206 family)
VPLFSPIHVGLVVGIAALAVLLAVLCRQGRISGTGVRLLLGCVLAGNELIWWAFRYSHEGLKVSQNLPLQLCDLTVWMTILACLTLFPLAAEFAYFVGLAGAGMSLLTPDLWSPWPSYPAIYFFVGHGGIVIAIVVLVFGGIVQLRPGAVWRVFGLLVLYGVAIGTFNMIYEADYMYLCRRPANPSLLDLMGPWPIYILAAVPLSLALFCLLWLPIRPREREFESPPVEQANTAA